MTTFADATGNGHTGTLVGSDPLSSVSAVIGTGVQFGGNMAADYISVPKTSDLGGMNTLTLSAWVNIPTEQNGYSMVFDMYGNGTDGNEVYSRHLLLQLAPKGLYAGANYYAANDYANGQGFWNRTDGSGYVAEHLGAADHGLLWREHQREQLSSNLRQRNVGESGTLEIYRRRHRWSCPRPLPARTCSSAATAARNGWAG